MGRQRAALDQLHGEVDAPGPVDPEIMHRYDIGMRQLAADLGFAQETPQAPGAIRFLQQLNGDIATQRTIVRSHHHAHAATTKLLRALVTSLAQFQIIARRR